MKINVGFWSYDKHRPEEHYECDSFFKLLLFLLPYLDKKESGFYSISFVIGER